MTPVQEYLKSVSTRFKQGISSEHSYRSDLEVLLRQMVQGIDVTNEPSKVTDCGNPDYVITRNNIPVGYIEAKDIGKDLNGKQYEEQLSRYKKALDNLIVTDYIWFQLYTHGEFVTEVRIGQKVDERTLKLLPENYQAFENLILNFCQYKGQTIRSSMRLAEMMAAKAKLLQHILEQAITTDEETQENTSLKGQYEAFQSVLIHDLLPKDFADIYAQTLAYGMFAARLHDPSLDTFSRQEAAELIPRSNPFLRRLFQYVAGYDIDDRIRATVDNLAEVFRSTNVEELLKSFEKNGQAEDPIIHFYEDFLSKYDPKLRKSRGVWYTPEPVVNFIVRAVDDILKTEFGLPLGLADTSTTRVQVEQQGKKVEKEFHKVQILDPATGTGTFLAEVVKLIHKKFEHQQGIWSNYVENHLIPRLNGFELLMASYAMAHLKLDLLLTETGFKPTRDQRFRVFLTNSLEEYHPDTGTLFANWVSSEANEANFIKRDTPVMVVVGNPPYSVSSTNKGEWIQNLIGDYKKDLYERKINLDDDYIKFIRYGQHYIDKNGTGILAYISNNSFLSGVTHRQMRRKLMESFDKIYILDLHGNSNIKETKPDGGLDKNVFDIRQGVSINIFLKKSKKPSNCEVLHLDLFGERIEKYEYLLNEKIYSINWSKLNPAKPYYFFTSKEFEGIDKYKNGFKVSELFHVSNSGIKTDRDKLFIDFEKNKLNNRINKLLSQHFDSEFIENYNIKDSGSYKLTNVIKEKSFNKIYLFPIQYRPFDNRWIYYDPEIISRPASKAMKHLVFPENLSLSLKRQSKFNFSYAFIHRSICESCLFESAYANNTEFPLYFYPDTNTQQSIEKIKKRTPNFNKEIVEKISDKLCLTFIPEKETTENTFAPIDILDYIYAVLHSPTYREKYKEFLKIDFPRVPYPKDQETFWQLVALGGQLREIHLLESPVVDHYITQYPVDGSNVVEKISYQDGKVLINATQYFDSVPEIAWNFYIGGYQPAQKWLKDRKGRQLDFNDIQHYQRIIVALTETDRLMKEVDKIELE